MRGGIRCGGGDLLGLTWGWVAVGAVEAVGSWARSWCGTTSRTSHVRWDVGGATSAKAILLRAGGVLRGVLRVLEGQTVHVQLISHSGLLSGRVWGGGVCLRVDWVVSEVGR